MPFSVTLVGTRGRMGAMFHEAWKARRPVYAVNRVRASSADTNAAFRDEDLAAFIPKGDVSRLDK